MRVRLASTVFTLMYRVAAISGLLWPEANELRDALLGRREGIVAARREACPLRLGERLPARGAEAGEGGGCFVEGGGGVAALAGFALRGAEHEQAAAEFERQPPLAGLGDDRRDRGHGRNGLALREQ
jgi:hypothetical protein